MQAVKYIGRKPFVDRLYGSGLPFEADQVRAVPAELARRFLRHPEFAPAELPVAAEKPRGDDTAALLEGAAREQAQQREQLNDLQELRDQVSYMDKEALEQFAQAKYRQNIDKRRSLPALREQVIGLIDQFGAA